MKASDLRLNEESDQTAYDIDDLNNMSIRQMATLSTETVNRLNDEITTTIAELKLHKAKLELIIKYRYRYSDVHEGNGS